ncbi:hypothetical protein BJ508DRAFT_329420 [Ascobolus immersus RN42]|uniref:Uncharacterized protein n=1 Tax=Ascobolus immersus RN42 TaxID=1160509 RepID=A0A3N4I918_ASCIM|nr:hypothetical protein BJ508DRAFT_329420 [Ascobolus immersus RN42]
MSSDLIVESRFVEIAEDLGRLKLSDGSNSGTGAPARTSDVKDPAFQQRREDNPFIDPATPAPTHITSKNSPSSPSSPIATRRFQAQAGSWTDELVNYYLRSKPAVGRNDTIIQSWIMLYRCKTLPEELAGDLRKFILYYRRWNQVLNVMRIELHVAGLIEDIEQSEIAMSIQEIYHFLDQNPTLKTVIPNNPVHPPWASGIDQKQMAYICRMIDEAGLSQVVKWLAQATGVGGSADMSGLRI